MLNAADLATNLAASAGTAVTVVTSVYEDDGSKNWATELATLLCTNPEHAKLSRDKLAEKLAACMGLDRFGSERLSKPLSRLQIGLVSAVLVEHGYDCANLKKGTDIRNIVKGNIRIGRSKPTEINTRFYADHIEIDGVAFQYRPRERSPMGMPEQDFCIRIAGSDVPLMAVLKLRNISLGQFRAVDFKAVSTATAEQQHARELISRDYSESRHLRPLLDELQRKARRAALALPTRRHNAPLPVLLID